MHPPGWSWADALLNAAKEEARQRHTTLRALVEEGLSHVLSSPRDQPTFVLPDASVDGNGLRQDVGDTSWEAVRAAAYGTRGG
ncbi:hypothetical protein BH23ACT9_BH23ACT9_23210 [soil metagenome]